MNILLVCGAGMSTSMLVQRIEKYAKSKNINATIEAIAETRLSEVVDRFDVVLLAPQSRFNKKDLKKSQNPKEFQSK